MICLGQSVMFDVHVLLPFRTAYSFDWIGCGSFLHVFVYTYKTHLLRYNKRVRCQFGFATSEIVLTVLLCTHHFQPTHHIEFSRKIARFAVLLEIVEHFFALPNDFSWMKINNWFSRSFAVSHAHTENGINFGEVAFSVNGHSKLPITVNHNFSSLKWNGQKSLLLFCEQCKYEKY